MDQQAREKNDYFKFKSLVFYGLILGILSAVFGITFFRDEYYVYTVICICYSAVKFLQMVIIQGYVNIKFSQAFKLFNDRKKNKSQMSLKEITHVFIIPNYNQDLGVLRQTISNLANHSYANNYCVFLAMQKDEKDCEKKAEILIKQYHNKFRLIYYTVHELQTNQAKGKPANINWCARHMPEKLQQKFVNLDSVMITIMDADSLAPQPYIDLVNQNVERNYDIKQKYIYQAPQIFYRNNNQSAFFVDIIDNFMSYMQCSQFVSVLGFTMGVSNYTISYKLLQKIGFWDTCKYSKCQDVRTPCKAFWKTNGQTQTVPIYIPFNQLNLNTGNGYWADFIARITQAKRHSQAQIELSYNLSNFLQNPKGNILKKLNICYIMLELYLIILVVFPTSLTVLLLQQSLHILPISDLDPGYTLHISNFVNTFLLVIGLSLFEYFKRKTAKEVYGIDKPFNLLKFLRIFPIYFPLAIIFAYFPSVMASYHLHNDNIMFTVTPKAINKNKEQDSLVISAQSVPQNPPLKIIERQEVDHSSQGLAKAVDDKI